MLKKSSVLLATALTLAACASPSQPRVIQASTASPEIALTVGMATQIELPDDSRVQSIAIGNKDIVSADQSGDVVNLAGKGNGGQTNMIIRARDADGQAHVYQYHITVQAQ